MRGSTPPPPNTPSWRGARLKDRETFVFTFCFYFPSFVSTKCATSACLMTSSGRGCFVIIHLSGSVMCPPWDYLRHCSYT
jgi:hypothetical protein